MYFCKGIYIFRRAHWQNRLFSWHNFPGPIPFERTVRLPRLWPHHLVSTLTLHLLFIQIDFTAFSNAHCWLPREKQIEGMEPSERVICILSKAAYPQKKEWQTPIYCSLVLLWQTGNLTTDEVDIPNNGMAGWMSGSKMWSSAVSSKGEEYHDLMWDSIGLLKVQELHKLRKKSDWEPTFKVLLVMALIHS